MSSEDALFGDPETRTRILQATWQLIEEGGVSPSLAGIAAKAGVSRQALYLHFGDRTGLMVSLVQYMGESLGKVDYVQRIFDAPTGAETLDRMIDGLSVFTAKVEKVARVMEAAQYHDKAIAAAWRNTMKNRYAEVRAIIQRIADDGNLADGWSIDTATDLFHTITMPGPWRELVREKGWTPAQYARRVKRLFRRSFLVE